MFEYTHKVHYYETDKMGIVHHSNYIRWMEEARVAFLDEIGASFAVMEARGLQSPVVTVACKYRRPTRFDDKIHIRVRIEKYNSVVLKVAYEMFNETTGELACTGNSEHCFVDGSGRPISIAKGWPDIDAALKGQGRIEK
ncbi:MAG: acyl-CoA thioesterase [Oscillospiraceae bacterium]|nr:acyl-CoA thioesterase [Oscillospiraceae bacterium]